MRRESARALQRGSSYHEGRPGEGKKRGAIPPRAIRYTPSERWASVNSVDQASEARFAFASAVRRPL